VSILNCVFGIYTMKSRTCLDAVTTALRGMTSGRWKRGEEDVAACLMPFRANAWWAHDLSERREIAEMAQPAFAVALAMVVVTAVTTPQARSKSTRLVNFDQLWRAQMIDW
jgi:hypothetical protein